MTHAPDAAAKRADAIIAGTLCLMSFYAQNPLAIYADRIAVHLARLATGAELTPELRTVCLRLAERWETICANAKSRTRTANPAGEGRDVH